MAQYKSSNGNNDDSGLLFIVFFIILFLLVTFFYEKHKLLVNTGLKTVIWGQLAFFAPFFETPARILAWFERVNIGEHPFTTMLTLLSIAGSYFRWLTLPVTFFFIWRIFSGNVIQRYQFNMTAQALIRHNAQFVPCLRPVADRDLLSDDIDEGPWRVAQQALQFAVANRLLLLPDKTPVDADRKRNVRGLVIGKNGIPRENSPCLIRPDGSFDKEKALSFDEKKTLCVFEAQMGERYSGKETLPDYKLGLAAAFMAFGCGNKEAAQKLLDHMSTTFKEEHGEKSTVWSVAIADAGELFGKYESVEEVEEVFQKHGVYQVTLLMALFFFAKHKGLLACSEFIWLKPMDRTLWYALNQIGGKAAWAEAAGPWAHYQFEEALGEAVEEKQCKEAAKALRYVLEMEGWLPAKVSRAQPINAPKPGSSQPEDPRARFQRGRS